MTGANRLWLVIPEDMPSHRVAPLRPLGQQLDVRVVPTENRYPRANPTLLLHTLAGRALRPGKLPTEAGALVLDATAAAAVGALLLRNEPMLSVPIGLYDRSAERAHLAIAPVGMRLGDLLGLLGVSQTGSDLTGGHPLREVHLTPDHILAGGELSAYAASPAVPVNPAACIRCAWCVEACPVRIQPAGLLEAAQQQDPELAARYGLEACIECGICTYVCPSNLPLLRGIRTLRTN
jgi:electron transport complex protein RnfC